MTRSTDENGVVTITVKGEHNHILDPRDAAVKTVMREVKSLATSTTQKPRQILAAVQKEKEPEVLAQLPTYDAATKQIRHARGKGTTQPTNPKSLADFVLPAELSQNGNLVVYDSGQDDPSRLVILSNETNMDFLETCDYMHVDGTFDSCPTIFFQIFTIHGKI